MTHPLPESLKAALKNKVFAHFATLMEDGSPHVAPVWIDIEGSHILVNSAVGRLKDRNVRRDPRVSLSFTEPENPYSAFTVRGKVVEITEVGADAHIDVMAKKYMGVDKYPYRTPTEKRVLYKIAVDKFTLPFKR